MKRIQELEAQMATKDVEEEVKADFKDRDMLKQSMVNWTEFDDDFEDYDEMTEEDQDLRIMKLQKEIDKRAVELDDVEKENLDSRIVMMSDYKEQLKMIDFFKQLILKQISRGELEQLRIQSKWSDKDNEYKVPVFYAKNGKVHPVKLPKHEIMIKLAELYASRTLKLKTDRLVQKIDMSMNFEEDTDFLNSNFFKNQVIDVSCYKSKTNLVDSITQRDKHFSPFSKEKQVPKSRQHRLPPLIPDN